MSDVREVADDLEIEPEQLIAMVRAEIAMVTIGWLDEQIRQVAEKVRARSMLDLRRG
jgi:hypothetical protein